MSAYICQHCSTPAFINEILSVPNVTNIKHKITYRLVQMMTYRICQCPNSIIQNEEVFVLELRKKSINQSFLTTQDSQNSIYFSAYKLQITKTDSRLLYVLHSFSFRYHPCCPSLVMHTPTSQHHLQSMGPTSVLTIICVGYFTIYTDDPTSV